MGKLDTLIKDFNKQYKEDIVARGIAKKHTKKIPFSSPRANYMLYGGIPRGRIIEFAGEENGGKTTTALDICANAQKLFKIEYQEEINELEAIPKRLKDQQTRLDYLKSRGPQQVMYADCENTLDKDWATKLGVNVDDMVILKPQSQTAEQIFEMLLQMMDTDEVGLLIIDSLGVMLSAQAYEKTMEEKTYGGIAAALTLFSKKAELLCAKYGCTLIGINQMREDMNSSYGGMITTGGKAWKHNCTIRMMFQKGPYIDAKNNELKRSAETPSGNHVMINIVKNKICKPDRRAGFYTLKYDYGIDVIADTVETAIKYGYVIQSGSWFNFIDIESGEILTDDVGEILKIQGKTNVIEYLAEDTILLDQLLEAINKTIKEEQ